MKQPEVVGVVVQGSKYCVQLMLTILMFSGLITGHALAGQTEESLNEHASVKQSDKPAEKVNRLRKDYHELNHFPRPEALNKDIHFWLRVYTEISTAQGFLHDSVNLSIVYETVNLSKKMSREARSRHIKKIKNKYQSILDVLARGKRSGLTEEQQRVLALWPDNVSNRELEKAKQNLRFQLGQSDKFKAGLIRSGSWKPFILKTLESMGLPKEISALPHVESSFNYHAYSKVGAAGMWQFTRSTGRRYMRIDHVLDERLDPFIASVAAARLLKNNYAITGSWPMAITAYNHGAAGMRRAAKQVGSKDIVKILRHYKSRSFGFASRNFYPSFLAAVEIDRHPEKYFANIQLNPPANYQFIQLPAYLSMDTVLDTLAIQRTELMASNPALRPAVWNGNKYIPRNYELRINASSYANINLAETLITSISPEYKYEKQKIDRFHRVQKGQTLSIIAARYKLRLSDLVAANNMRNKHHIRIGQVLILPETGQKIIAAAKETVIVTEKASPEIEQSALPEDGIYIVKAGDSMDKIAKNNAMSLGQLLKLNQIKNKHKIYPGQRLALIKSEEISRQKNIQLAQLAQSSSLAPEGKIMPEAFDTGEQIQVEAAAVEQQSVQLSSAAEFSSEEEKEVNGTAESLGDKVLEESKGELLADPSDYSVSENMTIEIQAAETLGHYAEWLQIRASELRRLNRMKYGQHVVVGKRLKLTFRKVTSETFEAQRLAYHKLLQETFFEQNQIVGEDKYRLNRGDSVWNLTQNTYKIPFWLLRQFNPELDMNRISADKIITFPKVKQRDS